MKNQFLRRDHSNNQLRLINEVALISFNLQIPVLASTNPSKACQQPGEVRFLVASKVAQLCTGSEWVNITTESDGTAHHPGPSEIGLSESHPARSCLHIRELGEERTPL